MPTVAPRPRIARAPSALHLARLREAAEFGPRYIGDPQPGFFQIKLVKGGVVVGARIRFAPQVDPDTGEELDRSWYWHGEINGWIDKRCAPAPTERVWRIWLGGERISQPKYEWLVADRAWAAQYAKDTPEARPWRPVDWSTVPLPFTRRR